LRSKTPLNWKTSGYRTPSFSWFHHDAHPFDRARASRRLAKTRTFSNRYACSAGGTSCSTDALRPCARVTFKSDFTRIAHDHCCCCNRWIKFPCSKPRSASKVTCVGRQYPFGTLQHALILLKANGSTAMLQYDLSQGEGTLLPNEALQPDKIEPTAYWYRGSAGLIRQTPIEHGAASAQTNRPHQSADCAGSSSTVPGGHGLGSRDDSGKESISQDSAARLQNGSEDFRKPSQCRWSIGCTIDAVGLAVDDITGCFHEIGFELGNLSLHEMPRLS